MSLPSYSCTRKLRTGPFGVSIKISSTLIAEEHDPEPVGSVGTTVGTVVAVLVGVCEGVAEMVGVLVSVLVLVGVLVDIFVAVGVLILVDTTVGVKIKYDRMHVHKPGMFGSLKQFSDIS